MKLIGLDIGTTGCKALLIEPEAKSVFRAFREYGIDADGRGKAEQNAEHVWTLAKDVLREVIAAAGSPEVAALSISAQGDAIIPVDGDGNALHPAILGMDYRCRTELAAVAERYDEFTLFQRTGMRPHPINSFLKMLWLRRERPDAFARAAALVTYSGFAMGRLGRPGVEDMCMASRSMAFNLVDGRWDEEILAAFDFPLAMLPEVIRSGSVAGSMRPALAAELGLKNHPLIVAGGHDQPVCGIGAGVIDATTAVVTTGTAEVLSRYLPRPLMTKGMFDSYYPCYCSAMGEGYFTFSLNHVGGLALRWFKDAWCAEEIRAAAETGEDPYNVILGKMPAGPSPMFALPHFTGSGTPFCDLSARASFVGMTLDTDKPTAVLALLEGLAFDLRLNFDTMKGLGIETSKQRNVGGGSRSPRWLQLKADVLGLPVEAMQNPDAGCVGAAILAGTGAGCFSSIADGVSRLVTIADSYEPDPRRHRDYSERYLEYRRLYDTLAPFYSSVRGRESIGESSDS